MLGLTVLVFVTRVVLVIVVYVGAGGTGTRQSHKRSSKKESIPSRNGGMADASFFTSDDVSLFWHVGFLLISAGHLRGSFTYW